MVQSSCDGGGGVESSGVEASSVVMVQSSCDGRGGVESSCDGRGVVECIGV